MNINVDINQLVNDIAQKLGVAVDQVYPMLYKQAMINGFWDIVWVVLSVIGMMFIVKWGLWIKKDMGETVGIYDFVRDLDDYFFHCLGIVVSGIVFLVMLACCFKEALDIFLNTDWYIIQYIMDYLK